MNTDEYRVCKVSYPVGGFPNMDELTRPLPEQTYIDRYEVQVKGLFLWHTIKSFKTIRPAARLLNLLRNFE